MKRVIDLKPTSPPSANELVKFKKPFLVLSPSQNVNSKYKVLILSQMMSITIKVKKP